RSLTPACGLSGSEAPMREPISDEEALDRAARILRRAERVAVLTGAGISAESGLATFRGAGGLWEGRRVEDVATPRAFHRGELLRPAVVWFEEELPHDVWKNAEDAVARCECLVVVGTSAIVYPAAGLIDLARAEGAVVIEVNVAPSQASSEVDALLLGPAGS